MTAPNDNKSPGRKKAKKPSKYFPLTAHPSGQWCKKVQGKVHYFGTWDDPQTALKLWNDTKDGLLEGRIDSPSDVKHAITVKDLCNRFLARKESEKDEGEIVECTWLDYRKYCGWMVDFFGANKLVDDLNPADFARFRKSLQTPKATFDKNGKRVKNPKRKVGLKSLQTRIAYCRAVFFFGDDNLLFDQPLKKLWGREFDKPSTKAIRNERKNGDRTRFVTNLEIKKLLEVANPTMKAMILLGINCGFGNTDVASIRPEHIDWEVSSIRLVRSKTGKDRLAFLWPETIEAITNATGSHHETKSTQNGTYLLLNQSGGNWLPKHQDQPVSKEFAKVVSKAKLTRPGLSFYALRHTFQTVADESKDFVAVQFVMGHAPACISDNYRAHISDERIRDVCEHVRGWLFSKTEKQS